MLELLNTDLVSVDSQCSEINTVGPYDRTMYACINLHVIPKAEPFAPAFEILCIYRKLQVTWVVS